MQTGSDLRFDFGEGRVATVELNGKQCVRFAELCQFIGADFEYQLRRAPQYGFGGYLAEDEDGVTVFEARAVPVWLFALEANEVAPQHRAEWERYRRGIIASGMFERFDAARTRRK